jgi:uncharacterized protein YndB with AHSA1/START domain
VEVEAGIDRVFDFLANPSNLTEWWPRVVRVEAIEGVPGQAGLLWTSVVEADSGRRLRLDYEMVEVDPGARLIWEHRLEGTAFGAHLVRQSTEVTVAGRDGKATIDVRLSGELRGAAKLAGPSLKSDQKKLLAVALERLAGAFRGEG